MNKENEDFVEDLVKNLPQGSPMTEFELKKFEKFIDSQIASTYPSVIKKPLIQRMSVAASVIAIFVGVGLFATQNNSIKTDSSILPKPNTSASENVTPTESARPTTEPTQSSDNPKPSDQGELFEDSDESGAKTDEVPVFKSKLNYETNFIGAKKIVMLSSKPGKFTSLTSVQRNCAITLGIDKELLAFDSGYFGPDSVMAFYVGQKKSEFVVKIALSTCELVAELEND